MFERYTEKARRVIFFARYEASQFGSPYIESEHLLLGLLREDRVLVNTFWRTHASIESIRKQIESRTEIREKTSTSVDLPLSQECKRVLAYAAEEAERLSHKHIGPEHLLLGLLREDKSFAAEILLERGLDLGKLRDELGRTKLEPVPERRPRSTSLLADLSRDLTGAAQENELEPLIGREEQLASVILTLSKRKNNVLLMGERGVGKRSLAHGLALRIAAGDVPEQLTAKRVLAVDFSPTLALAALGPRHEERVLAALLELKGSSGLIVYLEDIMLRAGEGRAINSLNLLKPLLTEGEIQCIAATTPAEGRKLLADEAWLAAFFKPVEIPAPDEAIALQVLATIKPRYERFHNVAYSEEALQQAVALSQRYIPERCLPDKAIDLLDEAGAAVAVRAGAVPEDLVDAHKRLRFVVHRMENAVANHEFEKAHYYSDEERKERENVRALREKYKLTEATTVGVDDIEAVVARMTGIPLATIREGRAGGTPTS